MYLNKFKLTDKCIMFKMKIYKLVVKLKKVDHHFGWILIKNLSQYQIGIGLMNNNKFSNNYICIFN